MNCRTREQYAEWGFDYLKYDWCSYMPELEAERELQRILLRLKAGAIPSPRTVSS